MTRIFDLEQELDAALTALALVKSENARLREALEEMAKLPYKDSDLTSFIEWINARARAALEQR